MPIITLLTDFGTRDSYVAEIRGTLLTLAPAAVLVDISHDVEPGDIRSGAYIFGRSWRTFPSETIHLAVVDPGVGSARRALALRALGHFFVGPDNGLFTPVLDYLGAVVELPIPSTAAATFHGRDVFAPAAAALARGVSLASLGSASSSAPIQLPRAAPRTDDAGIAGEVIHVDRFGTLVTNLGADATDPIEVAGARVPLRRTFSDVASGDLVALLGSGGTIEIAVRDGSAAERLAAGIGSRVSAGYGAAGV